MVRITGFPPFFYSDLLRREFPGHKNAVSCRDRRHDCYLRRRCYGCCHHRCYCCLSNRCRCCCRDWLKATRYGMNVHWSAFPNDLTMVRIRRHDYRKIPGLGGSPMACVPELPRGLDGSLKGYVPEPPHGLDGSLKGYVPELSHVFLMAYVPESPHGLDGSPMVYVPEWSPGLLMAYVPGLLRDHCARLQSPTGWLFHHWNGQIWMGDQVRHRALHGRSGGQVLPFLHWSPLLPDGHCCL